MNYLIFYSILLLPSLVECKLTYPSIDSITNETYYTTVPAYPALLWKYNFDVVNITVIDLQGNITLFNYCDLTQFSREGVLPLLYEVYNITEEDLDNGLEWIAFFYSGSVCPQPYDSIIQSVLSPSYIQQLYSLDWDDIISLYIQRTGAIGFIDFEYCPPTYNYYHLDNVDKEKGIVYGNKVDNVFGVFVDTSFSMDMYNSLYNYNAMGIQFIISLQSDQNPNDVLIDSTQPVYWIFRIISIFLVLVSVIATLKAVFVFRGVCHISNRRKDSFIYMVLTLVFGILGNISRIIVLGNMQAMWGSIVTLVPYYIFSSLECTLHFCSSFSSIWVWIDMLYSLHATTNFRLKTIAILRNRYLRAFCTCLQITVIGVDMFFQVFYEVFNINFFGDTGGTANPYGNQPLGFAPPSFFKAIFFFVLATFEIMIAGRVLRACGNLKSTVAPSTLSATKNKPIYLNKIFSNKQKSNEGKVKEAGGNESLPSNNENTVTKETKLTEAMTEKKVNHSTNITDPANNKKANHSATTSPQPRRSILNNNNTNNIDKDGLTTAASITDFTNKKDNNTTTSPQPRGHQRSILNTNNNNGDKDGLTIALVKKLSRLSLFMSVSGMLMFLKVFLLYLYYSTTTMLTLNSNPILLFVLYMTAIMCTQISSILEIMAIQEISTKVQY